MDLRHSVDGVAAYDAEVRHVDSFLRSFLDERHATQTIIITRPTGLHLLSDQHNEQQHGLAAQYLGPLNYVADLPGRRPLRSAGTNRLAVPPVK